MTEHGPQRRRLPPDRPGFVHRFDIDGHKGYVRVGLYPDDMSPGEVFIVMTKGGSTISGLANAWTKDTSVALQYGVPLAVLCRKHIGCRYEPFGRTRNPLIPFASSVEDYIFRWLQMKFVPHDEWYRPDVAELEGAV